MSEPHAEGGGLTLPKGNTGARTVKLKPPATAGGSDKSVVRMIWRRRSELNAHGISPGRLATCCHTVRRRLHGPTSFELVVIAPPDLPMRGLATDSTLSDSCWWKARESNPTRTKPPQFSRLLDSLYCRAFRKLAGAPGFEPRISRLESDGLSFSLRPRKHCQPALHFEKVWQG